MTNLERFVVKIQAVCDAGNSRISGTGVICLSHSEDFDYVLTAAHCILDLSGYDEENKTYRYVYELEELGHIELQLIGADGTVNKRYPVDKDKILFLKDQDFALLICDKEVARDAGGCEPLVFADGLKYLNEITILGYPAFASGRFVSFECVLEDNYGECFSVYCPELKGEVVQNFKGLSGSGCFYKDFPVYYGCVGRTMGNHNIAAGRAIVNRITAADVNGLLKQYFKDESFPEVWEVGAADYRHVQIFREHTRSLLKPIHTHIAFQGKEIVIDRAVELHELRNCLNSGVHTMIVGEGGCGKTALVKMLYPEAEFPFYVVKGVEFGAGTLEKLFGTDASLEEFIDYHKSYRHKAMVIDSAERLFENTAQEFVENFVKTLSDAGWQFIFTTRKAYFSVLEYQVKRNIGLDCKDILINHVTTEYLEELAHQFRFDLPENQRLRDRLRNSFYLNEYLNLYAKEVQQKTDRGFMEMLWHKKIMNSRCIADDIHLRRERSFFKYVRRVAESNGFYQEAGELEQVGMDFQAIRELVRDDVLEYEEKRDAYFIVHDIYEEWALVRMIEKAYFLDRTRMLKEIGTSLSMRRAFRIWLQDALADNDENILNYIDTCWADPEVTKEWKDEMVIAILLSEHAQRFFDKFDEQLRAGRFKLFYDTILHWLNTACLELDKSAPFYVREYPQLYLKPCGSGWKSAIHFIHSNVEDIEVGDYLSKLLPLVKKWTDFHKTGATTREAVTSLLKICERKYQEDTVCLDRVEKDIAVVLASGASEIREELQGIIKQIVRNEWKEWDSPYYELFSKMIAEPVWFINIFQVLPADLTALCELYWRACDEEENHSYERECWFNLSDRYEFSYLNPSAFHSPVYFMLKSDGRNTLDFIIRFVNESVEFYATHRGKDEVEVVELLIDEETVVRQYCNSDLWRAYRGGSHVPYLLESMHMALERYLLEGAETGTVEEVLLNILSDSKSVSLSAVVASVVCAHPEYFRIAVVLFGQLDFLLLDNRRLIMEHELDTLAEMGINPVYIQERKAENRREHRKKSLEHLFVNYEFFSDLSEEEFQNRQTKLYEILDCHKLNVEKEQADDRERILLARLDRRGMKPEIEKQGDQTILKLNPTLGEEQKKRSEEVMKEYTASMRYINAGLWAYSKYTGSSDWKKFPQFEDNLSLLLDNLQGMIDFVRENSKEHPEYELYYQAYPAYISYFLLRNYKERLEKSELELCKNVLMFYLTPLSYENYHFQYMQGTEPAVRAIPYLVESFPKEKKAVLLIILRFLLNADKNVAVCIVDMMSILWQRCPVEADYLLTRYVKLKGKYDEHILELRKQQNNYYPRFSAQKLADKTIKEIRNFDSQELRVDEKDLEKLTVDSFPAFFALLPEPLTDEMYLRGIGSALKRLIPVYCDRKKQIELRDLFVRKYTDFLFSRNEKEAGLLLQSFKENLNDSYFSKDVLQGLIRVAIQKNDEKRLWMIWEELYPAFRDKVHPGSGIIPEFLFDSINGPDNKGKVWEMLNVNHYAFFEKLSKDLSRPEILLYLLKLLNGIGSTMTEPAIGWIYTMLYTGDFSGRYFDAWKNLIEELENYMDRFVRMSKIRIKRDLILKNKVFVVLDFLIQHNSRVGFSLKDLII